MFPNQAKEYIPLAPNRRWVSYITYITIWIDDTHYAFCYLLLILNAYTKEIVGWCVGLTLDTVYPLVALDIALERIKDISKEELDLTHNSDRGCQYASLKYIGKLQSIKISTKISCKTCRNKQKYDKDTSFSLLFSSIERKIWQIVNIIRKFSAM